VLKNVLFLAWTLYVLSIQVKEDPEKRMVLTMYGKGS
jgi:hypothetical protein